MRLNDAPIAVRSEKKWTVEISRSEIGDNKGQWECDGLDVQTRRYIGLGEYFLKFV